MLTPRATPILAFVTTLCLGSAVAAAPSPSDGATAGKQRREAQKLFANGDYASALKAVDDSLALVPEHAEALRLRANILFETRDFDGALAAYEAFLRVAPAGGNRRAAEKIVKRLIPVRTTFLQVKVASGPVNVYLDSKSLGVFCVADPVCEKGMLPGDYKLILEREGFEPEKPKVTVEIGKTAMVERTLAEKPSALSVATTPAVAMVTLDGTSLGMSPQVTTVTPGDHQLEIRADGYLPLRQSIAAHEGKPVELSVTLREVLRVSLSVPEASLSLDGLPVALEDGLLELPLDGQAHSLLARAKGYVDTTVAIPAERVAGTSVVVTMRRSPIGVSFTHAPSGAMVSLDGRVVGTLPFPRPMAVDPGEHTIEIQAAGALPYRTTATFLADTTIDVKVTPPRTSRSRPFVIAAGATVATGLLFGTLGLLDASDHADRSAAKGVTVKDSQLADLETTGRRNLLLADISFGVAAAASSAAAYYWFKERGQPRQGRIDAVLAPTGVAISGSF